MTTDARKVLVIDSIEGQPGRYPGANLELLNLEEHTMDILNRLEVPNDWFASPAWRGSK